MSVDFEYKPRGIMGDKFASNSMASPAGYLDPAILHCMSLVVTTRPRPEAVIG